MVAFGLERVKAAVAVAIDKCSCTLSPRVRRWDRNEAGDLILDRAR